MNFLEWLSTNEARWRGSVGGAFSRDPRRMQQQQQKTKDLTNVATSAWVAQY
jgi:hypothetical protein